MASALLQILTLQPTGHRTGMGLSDQVPMSWSGRNYRGKAIPECFSIRNGMDMGMLTYPWNKSQYLTVWKRRRKPVAAPCLPNPACRAPHSLASWSRAPGRDTISGEVARRGVFNEDRTIRKCRSAPFLLWTKGTSRLWL